ncbi:hypothetical protein FK513_28700, partial [Klebsiella pneumoniae]|nr:hypothetical protein [Klebsiella pneumoniae]
GDRTSKIATKSVFTNFAAATGYYGSGGTGSAGGAASGNLRRLYGGLPGAYNLGVVWTNAPQSDLYSGKSGGAGATDPQGYAVPVASALNGAQCPS